MINAFGSDLEMESLELQKKVCTTNSVDRKDG